MIRSIYTGTTGMNSQQLSMDVIANNIANATSTRVTDGDGPYMRRRVQMIPRNIRTRWRSPIHPFGVRTGNGEGVVGVSGVC